MKTSLIKRLLDPDTSLASEYFLDDDGRLKMDNPTVQHAIFELIKETLVKRAKEIKAEAKEKCC